MSVDREADLQANVEEDLPIQLSICPLQVVFEWISSRHESKSSLVRVHLGL